MENELLSMKQEQKMYEEKVEGLEHEFKNTKDRLKLIDIIPGIKGELEHKLNRLNVKVTLMEIHDRKLFFFYFMALNKHQWKMCMTSCESVG